MSTNNVMQCYHSAAKGAVRLGAELADWMRSRGLAFEWVERPPLRTEADRT